MTRLALEPRYVVLLLSAAAVLVIAGALVSRSRGPGPAAPSGLTSSAPASPAARSAKPTAALDPCARHRPMNTKLGWVCREDRAPVDLVTERSMLMGVLHDVTPVLVLETERLDPGIALVDPKRPPQAVCVLKGASAGLSGYVAWAALHAAPCQK